MWDDEINKKIKDAADQYHPAYDERAWDKMKLLLDQHLPLENKRKRKYFLIPLFALLLGGSFFMIYYMQTNSAVKNSQNTETKNNISATKVPQQESRASVVPPSSTTAKPTTALTSVSPLAAKSFNNQLKNSDNKISINKQGKTSKIVTQSDIKQVADVRHHIVENSKTSQPQEIATENTVSKTTTTIANNANPDIKEEIVTAKKDSVTTKEVAKTTEAKESVAKKKPAKSNKSFRNNFAIDFSAGPDVSIVGFNNTGRIALNYAVGFSYELSRRFTLRTGFYISDKIYSANKNEYHVPAVGSANIDYLYNIDANCEVYELPVTVIYNFGKSKNHQWFAAAGLSSYIMKKESYDYYYKYPPGNIDKKSWSISNKNQNYFSVLGLSAGYEYLFSKRTSLLAEPYLRMPLSGIGAGKVKLNSGGILFTFTLKPFTKNKILKVLNK